MTELVVYLYAESPVHPGASDSLGALDLPVQREATTGYPVIWGQSLKGAIRQAAVDRGADGGWPAPIVTAVFGSGIDEGDETRDRQTVPGLLAVGDAQIVALPVPTLQHTFAWATSELALHRLHRKYRMLPADRRPNLPAVPQVAHAAGAAGSPAWLAAAASHTEVLGPCLVDLGAAVNDAVTGWARRLAEDALGVQIAATASEALAATAGDGLFTDLAVKLCEDLIVVGSDVMPTLLTECTEFVARVALTDIKTVDNGPFYSEYLPAETILAASLTLRPHPQQASHLAALVGLLDGQLVQIGGDETIGKGLVWTRLVGVAR